MLATELLNWPLRLEAVSTVNWVPGVSDAQELGGASASVVPGARSSGPVVTDQPTARVVPLPMLSGPPVATSKEVAVPVWPSATCR